MFSSVSLALYLRSKYERLKTPVIFLTLFYTISLWSLLRVHTFYKDDLGRQVMGYAGWSYMGRYLSDGLAYILSTGSWITDISPISQLIGCFFIAIASAIVADTFSGEGKLRWVSLLSVLPIGLSPYYLECFSFKYDIPFMSLSVMVSVMPFLFLQIGLRYYCIAGYLGILMMCLTYQASSGIFPVMVIFVAFHKWLLGKENIGKICRFLCSSIVLYLIAMATYYFMIPFSTNNYDLSIFSLGELIPGVWSNYYSYYSHVINDFRKSWLLFIGLISFLFLWYSLRNTKQNKAFTLLAGIAVLTACSLLNFGMYIMLHHPRFSARMMYTIGISIAIVLVIPSFDQNSSIYRSIILMAHKITCLCLIWCFISFSASYGNVLAEQQRYMDFRMSNLAEGLSDLEIMSNGMKKIFCMEGKIGYSPVIEQTVEHNNMLKKLLPSMKGGYMWNSFHAAYYYALPNLIYSKQNILSDKELPVLKDCVYYTIRGDSENILVIMKSLDTDSKTQPSNQIP